MKKLITILFLLSAYTVLAQECEGSLGPNLFEQGDFGSGDQNILQQNPGIAPGYLYATSGPPNDGSYLLTNDISQWSFLWDSWLVIGDNSSDPNGYMMVINASFEPGLFYEETIDNLCDNTLFEFSADVINLIRTGVNNHSDPNVDFLINDTVALSTGFVPKNESWNKYSFTFSTAPGQTSVKLSLRNNAPGGTGNDLAIDNISFRACGPLGEILSPNDQYACLEDIPTTLTALLDGSEDTNRKYQWEVRNNESDPWEVISNNDGSRIEITTPEIGSKQYRFASSGSASSFDNEKCRFYSTPLSINTPQQIYTSNDTLCGGTSITLGMQDISTPGMYILDLVASTGCDSIIHVTVDTIKRQVLTGITSLTDPNCYGINDGSAVITNVQGGAAPYHISIDSITYQGLVANDLSSGFHLLKVEDRFGCFYEEEINLIEPPQFSIDIGPDLDLILGDEFTITAASTLPISTITWNPEFENFNDQNQFTFLPITDGRITAEGISENDCVDRDTLEIKLDKEVNIYVPNAFSPNGDNINDEYFISTYGRSLSYVALFSIYDRWGNILWETKSNAPNPNGADQWDGKNSNNQDVQPGAYTYKMEAILIDGSSVERTGVITVIK